MEKNLLESVKEAVREVAETAVKSSFEIMSKGTISNIVTTADINIQKFLEKRLTQLLPESGFLGEESDSTSMNNEYCWIVDPIDGTQNFARNLRQSAVCVGLRHMDEVILGVVYNPFLDEMYWAEKGKGAFLNGERIRVSDRTFENGLFCTSMSVYDKRYAKVCNDIIMDAYYKCNDVRRFGVCSLELCYMASGKVEMYFEYRLYPWDYAAASLILSEAGGVIEDPMDKPVNLYNPCPVIAANNMENFKELKAITRKYISDIPY